MKQFFAVAFLAALLYVGPSQGSAINYSYFELGYVEADLDVEGKDFDGDGFEFNLSYGFSDVLAFVLGYQDVEFDDDVDASLLKLGIAYHKPYSNTGDVIVGLAAVDSDVDAPGISSIDESGNELTLEIRNMTSANTELSIGLTRLEIDGESDSGFFLGAVTGNPQGFQFVLDYIDRDDTSSIMLGLRSVF